MMDWADKIAAKCLSDGMGDGDTMRLVAEALRAEREACAAIAEAALRRARVGRLADDVGKAIRDRIDDHH